MMTEKNWDDGPQLRGDTRSYIPKELDRQTSELNKLMETISELEDKLHGVLGPERTEGKSTLDLAEDVPQMSPFAMSLSNNTDMVNNMRFRLTRLIDRVEA